LFLSLYADGEILVLELKDLYTRYTNDVIATAVFGIGVDSLKHPTNEFYMMGQNAFRIVRLRTIKFFGYLISPKLMRVRNHEIIFT
jgi:cytochrome P450 family 9